MYDDGMSTTEIAIAGNVSSRRITQILKKNNVELRPRGHWKRKYQINEDYFKYWSPNMAYILGFFLADGVISGEMQTVSFAQKEIEILEQIRDEMESNHPIGEYKNGVHFLNINSKIIKDDLMNIHGLTPNKSKTVEFPYVPDKYMHHFVRGYFDGDGSIYKKGNMINFVGGSYSFISVLRNILDVRGYDPNIKSKDNHFRIYISGKKTIKQFGDWIYTNKGLYLKRKFEIFNKEKLSAEQLVNKTSKKPTKQRVFLKEFDFYNSIEKARLHANITVEQLESWIKTDDRFASIQL
ncbi:endonuclease [Sutcliffiella horikoshii]|nr:endonuclease [Sutcliffiella horikoshii]